ncbi:MAG TPA: branched-chain amino acid ABC transporter permease [Thermodesulfobacteriota bacterium]|nr:branched-chain amino acid ABC transporter permease [Thermodesulfobacteriota bacterium]
MSRTRTGILLALGVALIYPILITDPYFLHMAILVGIYGLLAISLNLLLGYTGQLSLGHAAFFGVGAYLSSLLFLNLGISMWGGLVLALCGCGALGFFVAKLAFKLRGAYFVIMTIGIAEVLKLVALNWVDLTKGPMGLTDIAAPQISLGWVTIDFGQKVPYYYLVLFFISLSVILQHRLVNSSFGRAFVSIRENEDLAESVGIDCYKYLVTVVIISSSIAGIAGSLYAHYVSFIDPGVFAFFISVNAVMMAIGGGQGTQAGPILGAILFTLIPEWLRIFGDARMAVYALIVIFIVIFMPRGMLYYASQLLNLGKKSHGR